MALMCPDLSNVAINAWQGTWKMLPEALAGKRRYYTDFEVYDEKPNNILLV